MPGSGKKPPQVQAQIRELLEAGYDVTTIHRRLKVGRSSVYRMKRCLQRHGTTYTPAEFLGNKYGRPKVLSSEQELQIRDWLLNPENRTRYLDDLVWLCHERFGIICSTTTMSKLKRKWLAEIEAEETGRSLDGVTSSLPPRAPSGNSHVRHDYHSPDESPSTLPQLLSLHAYQQHVPDMTRSSSQSEGGAEDETFTPPTSSPPSFHVAVPRNDTAAAAVLEMRYRAQAADAEVAQRLRDLQRQQHPEEPQLSIDEQLQHQSWTEAGSLASAATARLEA